MSLVSDTAMSIDVMAVRWFSLIAVLDFMALSTARVSQLRERSFTCCIGVCQFR
ncbi:hypothetical protein D3C87_1151950 [compost metagenome]